MKLPIGVLLAMSCGVAQKPAGFEVASLKVHEGPIQRMGAGSAAGNRFSIYSMSLTRLITYAYDLQPLQLSFAPGVSALEGINFDGEARSEEGSSPTTPEFKQMVRELLADRFGVRFHREMKQVSGYALIVAKDGPKFHATAPDVDKSGNGLSQTRGGRRTLTIMGESTEHLARSLAYHFLGNQPVVNATGLTGLYDFTVEATPESRIGDDPENQTLSVFTAVRGQLGLRLEPRKVTTEAFVVDAAHKPTVN